MVKIGSFKGFPTISLMNAPSDKYPFTFGLAKAKRILENIEAIEKFVAENEELKEAA